MCVLPYCSGDFKRRLPRTPSTGTMSSADDLDDREPLSPLDNGEPSRNCDRLLFFLNLPGLKELSFPCRFERSCNRACQLPGTFQERPDVQGGANPQAEEAPSSVQVQRVRQPGGVPRSGVRGGKRRFPPRFTSFLKENEPKRRLLTLMEASSIIAHVNKNNQTNLSKSLNEGKS